MPEPINHAPVTVALFIHENASLCLSLLAQDLFSRANGLAGGQLFRVELVSARGGGRTIGGAVLQTSLVKGTPDFLLIPPMGEVAESALVIPKTDVEIVRRVARRGACVASACLGAFLPAAAGLLDGKSATTHWRWSAYAARTFSAVVWDPGQMICDENTVITAGGYLGVVDLCLYLVARVRGRRLAHDLGQVLLADSVRQKQSIYAKQLVQPRAPGSPLRKLETWISSNLPNRPTVGEMARHSGMSVRDFHRKFQEAFGVTPRKYVQLKRIELVQELLRSGTLSAEEAILRAGVSDIASFRKIFRRELGLSPAEFKRKLRLARVRGSSR